MSGLTYQVISDPTRQYLVRMTPAPTNSTLTSAAEVPEPAGRQWWIGGTRRVVPSPGQQATLPAALRNKITSFVRPRNWDGEGARGISASTCQAAVELAAEVHAAIPALPWPLAGVARWGAIALVWRLGERSVTALLASGRSRTVMYRWEGPGYHCGEAEGTRRDLIDAIAERWRTTIASWTPRTWAVTADIPSVPGGDTVTLTVGSSVEMTGEAAG